MARPTKEEIEQQMAIRLKALAFMSDDGHESDWFIILFRAYLDQMEELGEVKTRRLEMIAMIEQLQTENQALKVRLLELEA